MKRVLRALSMTVDTVRSMFSANSYLLVVVVLTVAAASGVWMLSHAVGETLHDVVERAAEQRDAAIRYALHGDE